MMNFKDILMCLLKNHKLLRILLSSLQPIKLRKLHQREDIKNIVKVKGVICCY